MVSCSNLKIAIWSQHLHSRNLSACCDRKQNSGKKEVSFEKGFRITRQEREKIEEKEEKDEIGEIKLTEEKEEIEDVPKMS